ncbi:MFS transporter [Agromyces binzhouensis]|uniref:MFS transporter n=1 Tax=Agromyces binzhouensis TaxID=1817495 RepID=A0A4Q2JNE7_9MICO|nr:MFS transporter [Agromyces binzhouensis]RXZ49735.1 MFS transporter [Agromyces binzhouensis]
MADAIDGASGAETPAASSSGVEEAGAAGRMPPTESAPRRAGLQLGLLIVNQLLAGIGVATGMALAAILVSDLTGVPALGGLSQSASVLGAAIAAIPLARLAVRSGRHVALAMGYASSAVGAVLIVVAASTGMVPVVFLGLAAFGAGTAAGLQARFAATEVAAPGFEARSMSLVLWATTIGSVAGPLLSSTGDDLGQAAGLPALVGPFVLSGAVFAIATLIAAAVLRLPRAGRLVADGTSSGSSERVGSWPAFRAAFRDARGRLAILAIVCAHTVMVGVMVMTPVHMTGHGVPIAMVGVVISIHILGMYAASPLMGWLVDRIGAPRVIALGGAILLAATLIGIFAPGDSMVLIPVALGLLGLGWSAALIGGSTLLTTTVEPASRVALQGATDAAMNVAAAASAALSGVVLGLAGFAGVNLVAMVVLVPLVLAGVAMARRARRSRAA